jgi:hypothetical protein
MHELQHDLLVEPEKTFDELANFLGDARNPKQCAIALGMEQHPGFKLARSAWDPIFVKMIYHADALTLHQQEQPVLIIGGPPPDPAQLLVEDQDEPVQPADAGNDNQDAEELPIVPVALAEMERGLTTHGDRVRVAAVRFFSIAARAAV